MDVGKAKVAVGASLGAAGLGREAAALPPVREAKAGGAPRLKALLDEARLGDGEEIKTGYFEFEEKQV